MLNEIQVGKIPFEPRPTVINDDFPSFLKTRPNCPKGLCTPYYPDLKRQAFLIYIEDSSIVAQWGMGILAPVSIKSNGERRGGIKLGRGKKKFEKKTIQVDQGCDSSAHPPLIPPLISPLIN